MKNFKQQYLIKSLQISTDDALDILSKAGSEELFEKAKHQVGDVHPNGRWVWTDLGNGKFDWKSKKGKWHGGTAGAATSSTVTAPAPTSAAGTTKPSGSEGATSIATKTPKAKSTKINKTDFKIDIVDFFDRYTDKDKLDISKFITHVKKKNGVNWLNIDDGKMSKIQKQEFKRLKDILIHNEYRVEDNGGFGTAIIETDKSPKHKYSESYLSHHRLNNAGVNNKSTSQKTDKKSTTQSKDDKHAYKSSFKYQEGKKNLVKELKRSVSKITNGTYEDAANDVIERIEKNVGHSVQNPSVIKIKSESKNGRRVNKIYYDDKFIDLL